MPIKNLLLHMANDDRHEQRLDVAIRIARKHGSHIHICYFTLPDSMPAAATGRAASYSFIAEASAIARERADKLQHEIEEKCNGLSWSFETLEDDHVEAMAERSLLADLAVVSQTNHASHTDRVSLHLPDRLTLVAPCPTLVLPHDPGVDYDGRHLMIAWKPVKESSRALRDSLGVLRDAEQVSAVILYEGKDRLEAEDHGEQLSNFLANHGIRVTVHLTEAHRHRDYGAALIDGAKELGADAIVMGAYSHSRFREMVLGGVTHHMLHHSSIPLIMSH